jgi:signal transduction histidine kinase
LLVDPAELKYFQEIFGDSNRYEQMLLNFLSNAIKFSKPKTTV